jgi:Tol biopolymer transport system component
MTCPRFHLLVFILIASLIGACVSVPSTPQASPTSTDVPPATPTGPVSTSTRGDLPAAATPAPTAPAAETSPSTPHSNLGSLAYVQDGDIWARSLPDGEPQQLTTDGRNKEPRWSPSGAWLAYRKGDAQVWLTRSDGTDARAIEDRAPVSAFAWAPAADRLAYVVGSGVLRLRLANADGTEPVTLVPRSEANVGSGQPGRIAWSPDGARIAFEWLQPGTGGPPNKSLWQVPAESGEPVQLYAGGQSDIRAPLLRRWTSDGRFVLFQSDMFGSASLLADGSPLFAVPADGGAPIQLADSMLVHDDFLDVAADSARVALTAGAGRETWSGKQITVVELPSGKLTPLTDEAVAAFSPAWSPDGEQIAYVAGPDIGVVGGGDAAKAGAAQRRIWVMTDDGSAKRQLTADPTYRDERPLWSDDGSQILFARLDGSGGAALWLIPTTGGKPQPVARLSPSPEWFGYYGHIDWDVLFDWWNGRSAPEKSIAEG